jgi:hypothetical protein
MSCESPSSSAIPVGRVWAAALVTWLVPGAGHFLLGRRGKAVLYFTLITFVYVLGLMLGDFRNISLANFELHFIAEVFYGGLTLPLLFLTSNLQLDSFNPLLDVGVLFTSVAGLLNVCVMVDVYETAYPRPIPADGKEAA